MRIALTFLFLSGFIYAAHAQQRCGSELYLQAQLKADPTLALRMQNVSVNLSKKGTEETAGIPGTIIIPVVVHVLYNTPEQNISNAQVQSQMDVLNKDFGKRNNDITNVPSAFAAVASDTRIQFALATVDPDGRPTNGIVRKKTSRTSWKQDDQMKFSSLEGDNAWNRDAYLNIWVCNLDRSLLGYASFPGSAAEKDGVVIRTDVFGSINISHPVYNKGRTTTHEVGHWLNLKHLWGNSDCGDDEVDDTPQQKTYNTGCSSFPKITANSCNNSPDGEMFMNFMDFSDDACIIMFTNGQAARMQALFAAGGARASLLTSPALGTAWNAPTPSVNNTGIILSPNPASQNISFLSPAGQACIADYFSVTDYTGKRLLQGYSRSTIDIYRLPAGIYLLHLQINGTTTVKKFIKK